MTPLDYAPLHLGGGLIKGRSRFIQLLVITLGLRTLVLLVIAVETCFHLFVFV